MKSFLKQIFTLSFLLVVLFTLINLLQTHFNDEPEHFKKQYDAVSNFTEEYEGFIIGTSHAVHSIRPTLLDTTGIKFYNFSLNGSNPKYYLNWYNNFISEKPKKPKYCIYAVNFFMFNDEWLWRKFEQDAEHFPASIFYNNLFFNDSLNKTDLIVNRFPVFKYRRKIKHSLLLKRGKPYNDPKSYDRGYITDSRPYDSLKFEHDALDNSMNTSQQRAFRDLVKQITDDGIQLVFVFTPEYGIKISEYRSQISLDIINRVANQYTIPVFNYNLDRRSSINGNQSLFTDWGHMNAEGSAIFSKKLAKDLVQPQPIFN